MLRQRRRPLRSWRGQQAVANFVNRYRCRNGSYRWLEWRSHPSGECIYAAARDITEHKEGDRILRLFQFATEEAADGIFWMNREGGFTYVNEQACRSLGYTREELMQLTLFDIDPLYPREAWDRKWSVTQRPEVVTESVESCHRRKDGQLVPIEVSSKHFWFGNTGLHVAFVRDITQRRRAESALKQSEQMLRKSQAVVHVGSYEYSIATDNWICTPELERIFGIDSRFPRTAEGWLSLIVSDDREMMRDHLLRHVMRKRQRFEKEYRIQRPSDGCERWVFGLGELEFDAGDTPQRMIGTIQDITERKQAEMALRASLEEKEALLKEVHHRVKNNLQIVNSLLSLQARQVHEESVQAALRDTQSRVRAMALLHEALYRSPNLAQVDFGAYVRSLCDQLARSYLRASCLIRIDVEISNIQLELEQAVPCGLIISELVTNSCKHAFSEASAGRIQVSARFFTCEEVELRVVDDGVGLPPGLAPTQTPSLGLQLVTRLTDQLGGQLRVEPGPGTDVRIEFPVRLKSAPLGK